MKPLIYKSAGLWCIAPTGAKRDGMLASRTLEGVLQIAKQCYPSTTK